MADEQKRQFVNFSFYKVDRSWRTLPSDEKQTGKRDLMAVVEDFSSDVKCLSYSTVGMRADADLMLWRISYSLESFQGMTTKLLSTGLGKYLDTTYSFLSMTKKSTYVDKHTHKGQEGVRLTLTPGEGKYLFVYPFVKTREWYLLAKPTRQGIMNEHIQIGHKYPSVLLNTTYSFGLDDQEFVVAFETNKPENFLDLVMELRGTESSRYTERDTPIFTCIARDLEGAIDALG